MPSAVVQKYPPRFNSLQLQFANMALSFGGTTYFTNLSEVAYSDTCEKGEARGISPLPMGVTQGEYKAQGSFSVHLIAWPDLQKILASQSPDGNSIYDAMFDISIQWAAKASPGQPQPAVQTHVLQSCFITGTDLSSSAGNARSSQSRASSSRSGTVRRCRRSAGVARKKTSASSGLGPFSSPENRLERIYRPPHSIPHQR